jgi:hypothetical protein
MWIHAMEQLPEHGQPVWYYGPMVGVWRGHYEKHPEYQFSPHLFICGEHPGVCDSMDAPYWMPISDERPAPPAAEPE